ncbi:MAG: response regulator [Bacteroidetes bacterium]|nr:response regulator [Bacteroidota bacterium]
MLNLLNNALKFTDKGEIEFGYETKTHNNQTLLQFYIRDTGIGIPKEKQTLIFDLFRQVDDTHTRRHGGTGIGLSIAKKLTELLGGTIWLESDEGTGSIFYFTIPFEKSGETRKSMPGQPAKKPSLKGKTVLIVEDVESSFDFLDVLLKKSGIEPVWAKDGKEAIELCRENSNIDLVLMDINMPVLNGYDATKKIKKFRPKLPIISQTAYAVAGDREKSLAAGCDDYIAKPIKQELLMEKIGKWLCC